MSKFNVGDKVTVQYRNMKLVRPGEVVRGYGRAYKYPYGVVLGNAPDAGCVGVYEDEMTLVYEDEMTLVEPAKTPIVTRQQTTTYTLHPRGQWGRWGDELTEEQARELLYALREYLG